MKKLIPQQSPFLIWLIGNIQFDGVTIKKEVTICGMSIEFIVTNYKNYTDLGKESSLVLKDQIFPHSIRSLTYNYAPIFIDCLYLYVSKYPKNINFTRLMKLCLELVYYTPTLISSPNIIIPQGGGGLHTWKGYSQKSVRSQSHHKMSTESFNRFTMYLKLLSENSDISTENVNLLDDLINITNLHDTLNQILLLWAFLEGNFNKDGSEDSDLEVSFKNMLENYYSLNRAKGDPQLQIIKRKIKAQNKTLGTENITQLRNVLAHGKHYYSSGSLNINNWTRKQSVAIFEQRNLLIEIIGESLINKIYIS